MAFSWQQGANLYRVHRKKEVKSKAGRKPLITFTRHCLSDGCDGEPFKAGRCSKCYYRRYHKKQVAMLDMCRAPHCGLKPKRRGYCYLCLKLYPNEKPRKQQKKIARIIDSNDDANNAAPLNGGVQRIEPTPPSTT